MQLAEDVNTELDRRSPALRDDGLRQPLELRSLSPQAAPQAGRDPVETAQEVGGRQDRSDDPAPETLRLLRELRRIWMSAPLRRAPHALLILSLIEVLSEPARAGQDEAAIASDGLCDTLAEFGPVFRLDRATLAMVIPGQGVRGATRIASAIKTAIIERNAKMEVAPLLACAGVAELVAEEDPVSTLLNARRSLARALDGDRPG